eukprot:gene13344-15697_t
MTPKSPIQPPPGTPTTHTTVTFDEEEQQRKREEERAAKKAQLTVEMLKVWKSISAHKYSHVFRNPISYSDAPDYDDVIKTRMDLTTLKKRMEDGSQTNCSDFYHDLMLIFNNAMEYNEINSDIYNMAHTLKKIADRDMEPVFALEGLGGPLLTPRSSRMSTTPSPVVRGRKGRTKKDSAPSTPASGVDVDDEAKTPIGADDQSSPGSSSIPSPSQITTPLAKPKETPKSRTTKRQKVTKNNESSDEN